MLLAKFKHTLKKYLRFLIFKLQRFYVAAVFLLYSEAASANPFLNAIKGVSDFIRGEAGVAIAVLVLAFIGIGAMLGRFSWQTAILFLVGAVILFEAGPLVEWWQGKVQSGA